jgi:hypothetical protein
VRLGVNWFFEPEDVDRIAAALRFIAEHGLALLPYYRLDVDAGVWRAATPTPDDAPTSLAALWRPRDAADAALPSFDQCLQEARALVPSARSLPRPAPTPLAPEEDALRWFWLPDEAAERALDELRAS